MPVVCVRIPHFTLRVAMLDQPHLDGVPALLSNPESGRAVVIDATPEAAETGVRPGLLLREATALCPDAVIVTPHPTRDRTVSHNILDQLDHISPLVEPDAEESGCWYLDLAGLGRHYTNAREAAQHILRLLPAQLRPRAGVGTGKFSARIAAGMTAPGTVRIVPPSETQPFLAEASVSWLPLPASTLHQFRRLGIDTLGQLANLPAAKVAARFGPPGRHAWQFASGHDDRRVTPPPREETVVDSLEMPTPAVSREMLMVGLRQMITRAFNTRRLANRQVRQVLMRADLEGQTSWERTLTLKEPSSAYRVIEALELRLQTLEFPGPVLSITLELSGIVTETARQHLLPAFQPRHTGPLTAAIRQLKHRYGLSPLYHVVEVEPWSRIPERRHALLTYDP